MSELSPFPVPVNSARDERDAASVSGTDVRTLRAMNRAVGREWTDNWRRYWTWCAENDRQPSDTLRTARDILQCCACYDEAKKFRRSMGELLSSGYSFREAVAKYEAPICEGCETVERCMKQQAMVDKNREASQAGRGEFGFIPSYDKWLKARGR